MIIKVSNSFCDVLNPTAQGHDILMQVLSYKQDFTMEKKAIFGRMNRLKYVMGKERNPAKQEDLKKKHRDCVAKLAWMDANEWVYWYKNGRFPTGLLNIAKAALREIGQEYQIEDVRTKSSSSQPDLANACIPHEPRYYQQEMIDVSLREGRGVNVAAVGTGKSLVMAYLIKNLANTSLVVVPSRGLLDQIYNDFRTWFGDHNVDCVSTKMVRSDEGMAPIRICTVQTLAALQKSGDLLTLIHDVEALYIDEIHHAGASSYTNLLNDLDHIYYRYGFTGTFLRNDHKILDMWGFLSNVLYTYSAAQAIQDGFLTPLEVRIHDIEGIANRQYKKEYDMNYSQNTYFFAKIAEIVESYPKDQILILVALKEKCGHMINEYLKGLGIDNAYVSGDNSKEEITAGIAAFNRKDVRVLIGSSVIGEGIDVRSTDHLIMSQGGKSEIVMVQAAGRAVRLYEGKSKAYIHDFRFLGTKYMEKHLVKRKDVYQRNFQCEIKTSN